MAGKWLAAFLETDDALASASPDRAVSANSANSPPIDPPPPPIGTNGTIGTAEQTEDADYSGVAQDRPCGEDELEERAALVEFGAGVPRQWAEGYAALSSMSPASGFSVERWRRIVDAAGVFLDRWAAEAIRHGWSELDLFGCNPDAPDRRFDAMGLLLLLDRSEVVSIDEGGADLVVMPGAARQRYRRRPLPTGTVSLWDLAQR